MIERISIRYETRRRVRLPELFEAASVLDSCYISVELELTSEGRAYATLRKKDASNDVSSAQAAPIVGLRR